MSGIIIDDKETAQRFNEMARHKMIVRLMNDILADLAVCELEGWDKLEYLQQLQDVINHFTTK